MSLVRLEQDELATKKKIVPAPLLLVVGETSTRHQRINLDFRPDLDHCLL